MKDKVVLITGGSRGIGKAAALEFAATGAKVIIFHSDPSVQVGKCGGAREIVADVSDEGQVKNAVNSVVAEFGKIDILVNNAGIAIDKSWDERTVADFRKTLDVNLIGTWLMSKYVGEVMLKNKYGKIVNMSSTNGNTMFNPLSVDYDASKAGIASLTKDLSIQFAPFVNVNAVAPGMINTDMNKDAGPEIIDAELKNCLFARMGEPAEIAKIIRFLASDDASYINGAVIVADGGRL
jgi:3-oxoacyl-[acyl-carrier protein] reductase